MIWVRLFCKMRWKWSLKMTSRGVSSAEKESHKGDKDSSALNTKRVAKSTKVVRRPDLKNSGSRPNRNRHRNNSRSVPKTPWLWRNLNDSVIKVPNKHWKVRYEDPPPPKRRKRYWTFRETWSRWQPIGFLASYWIWRFADFTSRQTLTIFPCSSQVQSSKILLYTIPLGI